MICFKKNWKNHFLNFFFSKSTLTSCLQTHVSQICAKKFKKLSLPVLWKRFEIKSHQRRAHYLNPPRNGGRLTAGGGSRSPPPVWLGLSCCRSWRAPRRLCSSSVVLLDWHFQKLQFVHPKWDRQLHCRFRQPLLLLLQLRLQQQCCRASYRCHHTDVLILSKV